MLGTYLLVALMMGPGGGTSLPGSVSDKEARDSVPAVVVACTIDYAQQIPQAVILARSIRTFGGALSQEVFPWKQRFASVALEGGYAARPSRVTSIAPHGRPPRY